MKIKLNVENDLIVVYGSGPVMEVVKAIWVDDDIKICTSPSTGEDFTTVEMFLKEMIECRDVAIMYRSGMIANVYPEEEGDGVRFTLSIPAPRSEVERTLETVTEELEKAKEEWHASASQISTFTVRSDIAQARTRNRILKARVDKLRAEKQAIIDKMKGGED